MIELGDQILKLQEQTKDGQTEQQKQAEEKAILIAQNSLSVYKMSEVDLLQRIGSTEEYLRTSDVTLLARWNCANEAITFPVRLYKSQIMVGHRY